MGEWPVQKKYNSNMIHITLFTVTHLYKTTSFLTYGCFIFYWDGIPEKDGHKSSVNMYEYTKWTCLSNRFSEIYNSGQYHFAADSPTPLW